MGASNHILKTTMALLKEKIGYGFGDMASSMFWKVFSYYLPFFYSNVFGLSLVDAAFLVLITRIWDAVSDPMMGIIADPHALGQVPPLSALDCGSVLHLRHPAVHHSRLGICRQTGLGLRHIHPDDDRIHRHQRALRRNAGCDNG